MGELQGRAADYTSRDLVLRIVDLAPGAALAGRSK
jgi:hypothetical protein